MKTLKILLILSVVIWSCKLEERFAGGVIQKPGIYKIGDSLIIEIVIEKALVEYSVRDVEGKLKIKTIHPFSDYQAWAFYLEDNGNLWVISSDIGYAYFEVDKDNDYKYHELPRGVKLQNIPEPIIKDLPEFFD